jgi:predicted GNAT superfamily acetyltransferase
MGQVCVDKNYRGQGVFRALYNNMKTIVGSNYNAIITDIDTKNTRSLKAHYTIGFKPWHRFFANNQNWEIVIWEI